MTVYVVRHAKAGSRRKWAGPDEARPLTKAGRAQADGIADWLVDEGVTRLVSSPFVRCIQTLEPLAHRIGLAVEVDDALSEGTPLDDALRLVEKLADQDAVVCSHGDVVGALADFARRTGARVVGDGLEKGSTWSLHFEAGAIVSAHYVPPRA